MTSQQYRFSNPTQETSTCYHCGDPCPSEDIREDEKVFCCTGCKTVYGILSENNLDNYYELNKQPGIKQKHASEERFAFLDNKEIAQKLLSFSEENLNQVNFFLPGVHCSSCIWLLENLYTLHPGILSSRVNFARKEIHISFRPQEISLRDLVQLLVRLGYEPQINLENLGQPQQNRQEKSLIYKIGITGFCFGNIMLLSFPDYLALGDWLEGSSPHFFSYLNILLSIPVIFYGGMDYLSSAYHALRARTINLDVPISLGIIALLGRSLFEIISATGAGYLDSLAGLIFFLLIGKWFQGKTYQGLSFERDYRSYFPLAVSVQSNGVGKAESKLVTELEKNDRMLIRNQELIPADSILVSEKAFIDYSFVTGESEPIEKLKGEYIYAGGRQVGSRIELLVQKEVSQSYLTQLWNNEVFKRKQKSHLPLLVDQFSKYFTFVTLLIAFVSAVFWYFVDPQVMWNSFTAVLIVACPCALALSMPYALGNTMRIFGRNHFYLKNAEVVSHLNEINHIVFDKTGTITQSDESELVFEGEALSAQEKQYIKSLAQHSTHPYSRRITQAFAQVPSLESEYFREIEGQGIFGKIQGIGIKIGSASFTNADTTGYSLKAGGPSQVFVAIKGQVKGYFLIRNKYRSGLKEVLKSLGQRYIMSLISGDHTAEKERLSEYFQADQMKFNQKPADKLTFIQSKQAQAEKVLMLGDGLNDAGALEQSDVGIAITEDTSSFSPACDAILHASAFDKLPQLLQFSQKTLQVVRLSFGLSLLYNLIGVAFAVSGYLSPIFAAILMPTSSISVVALVVGATNFLAYKEGLLDEE